jgi:hypothetical protein
MSQRHGSSRMHLMTQHLIRNSHLIPMNDCFSFLVKTIIIITTNDNQNTCAFSLTYIYIYIYIPPNSLFPFLLKSGLPLYYGSLNISTYTKSFQLPLEIRSKMRFYHIFISSLKQNYFITCIINIFYQTAQKINQKMEDNHLFVVYSLTLLCIFTICIRYTD